MLARGLLLIASAATSVWAGNTTCKSSVMDWWTESVGETPCRIYEQLQQVCSPSFQVGNMKPDAPGDTCDNQLSACCCNHISFTLSMLCMNCQYGENSTYFWDDKVYDAPTGGYGQYLNSCGPVSNESLPDATQKTVCNQGIRIPTYTYVTPLLSSLNDGWDYKSFKDHAQSRIGDGTNGTMAICDLATFEFPKPPGPNIGAIVGGVIGGVVLLVVAALVCFFRKRRQNSRGDVDLDDDNKSQDIMPNPFPVQIGAPAQPAPQMSQSGPDVFGQTHPDLSLGAIPDSSYAPTRPQKLAATASSPPNRQETHEAHVTLVPDETQHLNERHEDSEVLTSVLGLGRSSSGRLPPSYQPR